MFVHALARVCMYICIYTGTRKRSCHFVSMTFLVWATVTYTAYERMHACMHACMHAWMNVCMYVGRYAMYVCAYVQTDT